MLLRAVTSLRPGLIGQRFSAARLTRLPCTLARPVGQPASRSQRCGIVTAAEARQPPAAAPTHTSSRHIHEYDTLQAEALIDAWYIDPQHPQRLVDLADRFEDDPDDVATHETLSDAELSECVSIFRASARWWDREVNDTTGALLRCIADQYEEVVLERRAARDEEQADQCERVMTQRSSDRNTVAPTAGAHRHGDDSI